MKLFLVECPIESCYVLADPQVSFLAKKAPGGRSWGWDDQKSFTRKPIKQVTDCFNKIPREREKEVTYNRF
jgi:hypothetical protein